MAKGGRTGSLYGLLVVPADQSPHAHKAENRSREHPYTQMRSEDSGLLLANCSAIDEAGLMLQAGFADMAVAIGGHMSTSKDSTHRDKGGKAGRSRRRRMVAQVPVQLQRLLEPPIHALMDAISANMEVQPLLQAATTCRCASIAQELSPSALPLALAPVDEAVARATDLLMEDATVLRFSWTPERVAFWLFGIVEYWATGQAVPLCGLEALLPDQKSRWVEVEGQRVFVPNGASPAELAALQPYHKWEAEQQSGQPATWRGKSHGDGALWSSLEDFLDDLWTTLEQRCQHTGKPYGHDPVSDTFCQAMRAQPAAKTMYKWLRKAGLRPSDIKSGKVTRCNYVTINGNSLPH